MASNMYKLAKELKQELDAADDRKPKPYDTQAEVIRVEDGVAWVHIPGGVEETPVSLTIDAKKGDMVNIHVANGSAWITGNGTRPPTDDTTANYAVSVSNEVRNEVTVLNTIVNEEIEATNARFGTIEANEAVIHDTLVATNAHVEYLESDWISTDRLVLTGNNKNNYPPVEITESEFNVNKTAYYTKSGDTYTQCTSASVYDPNTQYYVQQSVQSIIEAINTANNTDPQVVVSNDKLIAASMDVAELSAITANMGTLTAGKIEKGNNFINLNTSPASMEFKNNTTWALATQGIQVDTQGNLSIKGNVNITGGNVYTRDETDGALDALTEASDNSQDRIDALEALVAEQGGNIQNLTESTSDRLIEMENYVNQYLGANGVMSLDNTGILISQGGFELLITGQALVFQDHGEAVAYMSNQELNITSARITSNLTLGPFKWVIGTNRLTLMRV